MGYGMMGRGDYGIYRGDPGLFGFIKKIGGGLLRTIGGATPFGFAQQAARALTKRAGRPPPPAFPGTRGLGRAMRPPARDGGRATDPWTGFATVEKRRRMNVANPKALRKAIRRTSGFVKLAKKALKGTGFRIVTKGSRSRRDLPPGHTHVR